MTSCVSLGATGKESVTLGKSKEGNGCSRVQAPLGPLLPLFERERYAGRALALGVLVHTSGSTYQKAGALILIAANGDYAGLISGGCLEGDLREHARRVIADGEARTVRYDLRGPQELLWGLGLGCEGALRILLLRAGPENAWQPLSYLAAALHAHQPAAVGIVCGSACSELPVGTIVLPDTAHLSAPLASTRLRAASRSGRQRGTRRLVCERDSGCGAVSVAAVPPAAHPAARRRARRGSGRGSDGAPELEGDGG